MALLAILHIYIYMLTLALFVGSVQRLLQVLDFLCLLACRLVWVTLQCVIAMLVLS